MTESKCNYSTELVVSFTILALFESINKSHLSLEVLRIDSVDDFKVLIGAWTDVVGKILSAYSEMRAFVGLDEYNNQLVAIGEGLQALGTMIVGTTTEETPIIFAGSWIDGTGAATSSYAAYLRQVQGENDDNIRLEILGDSLQAMGAFFVSFGEYLRGQLTIIRRRYQGNRR
ncbi:MAG: DUF6944 family repetitive protein [Bacillota bacterium]